MKYLFGPVNSRRLGLSQGIDLIPSKVCNFNCIYCEVGPTVHLTCDRQEYYPTADIIAEIDQLLADPDAAKLDIFTVTASGEPTLHSGLGTVIRHIKSKTDKPVAVLTNGSTFHRADVRQELMAADLVIPSLDSARPESYRRINRPAQCADLDDIINGLVRFGSEFTGEVRLEILLAKGINDSEEDIDALVKTVAKIRPARIQLNTVVRPPLESFAHPVDQSDMMAIAAKFSGPIEIIADFNRREQIKVRPLVESEILEMLKRRPCTIADISAALNFDLNDTADALTRMKNSNLVREYNHIGKTYYQTN